MTTIAEFDVASVTGNWGFPNRMLVGPGRMQDLPTLCRDLGFRRPLIVADAGIAGLPMVTDALAWLKQAGLGASLFSDFGGNPVNANVIAGVATYHDGSHDSVIAFGGGSALDTGKAIALMAGQSCSIWDLEDIGDNWKRADASAIAPVIAIPTTAGTGSEVGRASVIINEETERKIIVFHPRMLPVAVILDPEVTAGLPPHITAATGFDAFIHCFEAWCAPGFHPMADGLALQGMRLVAEALPRACKNGSDLTARTHMLAAASMGAMAFQKGLGAVHAISHPVGALYHTHHGLTNAVVLPYVMRFNRGAIEGRMKPVAQAVECKGETFDDVFGWVLAFREQLGIPHTLRDIGVTADRAEDIGRLAEVDPSAGGNPVPVTAHDLSDLFTRAVEGRL